MGRANCCNICTPPPDACSIGACCHDADGDNIDITCEDYVTESYCLTQPNSVFSVAQTCGEKISCGRVYETKLKPLDFHGFIVIKGDGSVVTIPTTRDSDFTYQTYGIYNQISEADKLRVQPVPFGENGAIDVFNNPVFCFVQKKDGTFVTWGAGIIPGQDPNIEKSAAWFEEKLGNDVKKIVFTAATALVLRENGTVFLLTPKTGVVGSAYTTGFDPPSSLEEVSDNPVVDIFSSVVDTRFEGTNYCALLRDGTAYVFGPSRQSPEIFSDVLRVQAGANEFGFFHKDGSFSSSLAGGPTGNVTQLVATKRAFGAVVDGTEVYVWGNGTETVIPEPQQQALDFWSCRPKVLYATDSSFAATIHTADLYSVDCPSSPSNRKSTLLTWGDYRTGGDSGLETIPHPFIPGATVTRYAIFNVHHGSNPLDDPRSLSQVDPFYRSGIDQISTSTGFRDLRPNETDLLAHRKGFFYYDTQHWGSILHTQNAFYSRNDENYYNHWESITNLNIRGGYKPTKIIGNLYAFCLFDKNSGYVVSVGSEYNGGYGTSLWRERSTGAYTPVGEYKFKDVISNEKAFAGITTCGSLVCWGDGEFIGKVDIGPNLVVDTSRSHKQYKGCTSVQKQKDFCKTEANLRCNIITGECDYNLGEFFPFTKVQNCQECEKINYNAVTAPLSVNFNTDTNAPSVPGEPTGSCCWGILYEDGYGDLLVDTGSSIVPLSELKDCFTATDCQCNEQSSSLSDSETGLTYYFNTYHSWVRGKTCEERTGDELC